MIWTTGGGGLPSTTWIGCRPTYLLHLNCLTYYTSPTPQGGLATELGTCVLQCVCVCSVQRNSTCYGLPRGGAKPCRLFWCTLLCKGNLAVFQPWWIVYWEPFSTCALGLVKCWRKVFTSLFLLYLCWCWLVVLLTDLILNACKESPELILLTLLTVFPTPHRTILPWQLLLVSGVLTTGIH